MSKSKRLRKRLTAFVNKLGPDEAREQLVLAYLQMEKCRNVLRGYDVEPVTMMDNGESSDLELFYQCKKTAEELAYLNKELILCSCDRRHIPNINISCDVSDYMKKTEATILATAYHSGVTVWYYCGHIKKTKILSAEFDIDNGWLVTLEDGSSFKGFEGLFRTKAELVENLKKNINGKE